MKPEAVIDWREALVRLADQHFFDLMRLYLGAVRTPFNKQKLVEELSNFLRKKENRARIVSMLDDLDLMILSTIVELPIPGQQQIISLLEGSYSFPELYDRILNLEERLVIYRRNDNDLRVYAINPFLADEIMPLVGMELLVRPESRGEPRSAPVRIDDLSLAALYSFFLHDSEPVKNDGSFRKKTLAALESIFPHIASERDCLFFLVAAFQNLGLLVKSDGILVPDSARWKVFAEISFRERLAYLAAAAGGRMPREQLQQRAQMMLDFTAALQSGARYHKQTASRLARILREKSGSSSAIRITSRFSSIIHDRDDQAEISEAPSVAGIEQVAVAFGIILEEDGLLVMNSALGAPVAGIPPKPYLVVSPSFNVTLLPGFSLAELLPLVLCLEVQDIQIAGQFEITRASCGAAFDEGMKAEGILKLLNTYSTQPLPGNIAFSIGDWYRSWASVALYHGFVLKVDESRRVVFENNEHLTSLIRKTLAPGVYLLSTDEIGAISEAFSSAGLESVPAVSTFTVSHGPVSLPPLKISEPGKNDARVAVREEGFSSFRPELVAALEALSLETEIHETLLSRIDRRIVLKASQLDPESVRIEKVEAKGMDFLGKIRIAEYALASGSLLEITMDEKDGNRVFLGRPVSTEKRTGDMILKIVTEPEHTVEMVSLGHAQLVRRIRGSIFSDVIR